MYDASEFIERKINIGELQSSTDVQAFVETTEKFCSNMNILSDLLTDLDVRLLSMRMLSELCGIYSKVTKRSVNKPQGIGNLQLKTMSENQITIFKNKI